MSISSMQSRVRSLRRRLIVPLVEMQVGKLADEFVDDWQTAKTEEKPLPKGFTFVQKVAKAGFWFLRSASALDYIDQCNLRKKEPDPTEIFRGVFPKPLKA